MDVLAIVLSCLDIALCIAIIVLVVYQQGNDEGMGVIAGGGSGSDTFFGKEKGRTLDGKLKTLTKVFVILFAIISVVLYLILANGL